MNNLTSLQAKELSDHYLAIAKHVGDYRFGNWATLSNEQRQQLGTLQDKLLDAGEDILAKSVQLILNETESSLKTVKEVTTNIQCTINKLKDVQKVINVAAAAVTLSAAIISKDLKNIGKSLDGFVAAAKELQD